MRKLMTVLILALPLLAAPIAAFAQASPLGTWTTIDDATGKVKSVVEIYATSDGRLAGRVEKVLQSDRGPNPVCEKCPGDRRNKPVEGMVILWGMKPNNGSWEGGKILDPSSGKVYSARIRPVENGKKLEVRGFMGFSLLGRTQVWVRQ